MAPSTNSDNKFKCGDKVRTKNSSVVYTIGAFVYFNSCGCYKYVTTTQNGTQGKVFSESELERVPS